LLGLSLRHLPCRGHFASFDALPDDQEKLKVICNTAQHRLMKAWPAASCSLYPVTDCAVGHEQALALRQIFGRWGGYWILRG
jgi:hypothetical protein